MTAGPAALLDAPRTRLPKRSTSDPLRSLYCASCNTVKRAADFLEDRHRGTGRSSRCASCDDARLRAFASSADPAVRAEYARRHEAARVARVRRDPEAARRRRARDLLRDAVSHGRVVKPNACSLCGGTFPPERLHGHHHDYSKPLDVTWLCGQDHLAIHPDPRTVGGKNYTERTWGDTGSTTSSGGAR